MSYNFGGQAAARANTGPVSDEVVRDGPLIVTPVVNDYILCKAYIRMVEEGTLEAVFYQAVPTISEFLAEYLTAGKRVTLGCFREMKDGSGELCGLGWVCGSERMGCYTKAETGTVFFHRQSDKRQNLRFGQLMLQSFFTRHNIDVLFGFTPERNKLALRYAQKLGFSIHGPIPDYCSWKGELAPGWISHLSKAEWLERQR